MIVPMEKVFLCGLSSDSHDIMAKLMQAGCIQLSSPESLPEMEQVAGETVRGSADTYAAEQHLSRLRSAIAAVTPFAEKKGMFVRKQRVTFDELAAPELMSDAEALCAEIEQNKSDISSLQAEKAKAEFGITAMQPWQTLDMPLGELATRYTVTELAVVPAELFQSVEEQLEQAGLHPYITEVSSDEKQHYITVTSHRGEAEAVWDVIRRCGASKAPFELAGGIVTQQIADEQEHCKQLDGNIEFVQGLLREKGAQLDRLKFAYDGAQLELDRGRALQKLLRTGKTFICTAWIPAQAKADMEALLADYPCYFEYHEPEEGEEAPVLLKNSKLVEPYEAVTEMYSVPSYNGIDPNACMAPFFFVFFGMMLSDAGYGLLMLVGGLVALKKMDLGATAQKFMKLVAMCGVSTMIFGLAYGTLFGDLIPSVASTFFGKTVAMPLIIDPLSNPILMLGVCMALGVIHIFFGMGISAYMKIKRGKPWDALFDVGFWYMLIIGLIMLLGGGMISANLAEIGKYVAIAGAVGLVCTQGRDKPTIFGKFFGGLKSLYDITSYFSDVLSYSRILALGLATGVIGTVINLMGGMINIPVVKVIAFVLIFAVGHGINFGINVLGAYVHTARLQYVEFYGKFFEGGGVKFVPFKPNTKYVIVNTQEE